MLDSSSQQEPPESAFDPHQHFVGICKKTKVSISPYSEIVYPSGWQGLMEKFVRSIALMSCTIETITQEYGYLDMRFTAKTLANEAKVLRNISQYRRLSHETCLVCGGYTSYRPEAGWRQVCKTCLKTAGRKGLTGTWLDKY